MARGVAAAAARMAWQGGQDRPGWGSRRAPRSARRWPRAPLVASGASVATDRKQRARLEMDDGTILVLDRDTEIELDPSPATSRRAREARRRRCRRRAPRERSAREDPHREARLSSIGTELTVTATDDTTDVQVTRGSVRAKAQGGRDVDVEAGQEALISAHGIDVGPVAADARAASSSELSRRATSATRKTTRAGGVGELRARRPGHADEKDRTLRIASHAVKVRIAGAMARTEIDETFANDTDDDLEGIYRFPVPAGRADRSARARRRRQARRGRVRREDARRGDLGAARSRTRRRRSTPQGGHRLGARAVARSGAARVAAGRPLRAPHLPDPEARLAARRPRLHADRRRVARAAALRLPASEHGRRAHRMIFSIDAQVLGTDRRGAGARARLRPRAARAIA